MAEDVNPAWARLLQHLTYAHLPAHLQPYGQAICEVGHEMVKVCKDTNDPAEVTAGLRKLIEAKDCFVRAMVP